MVKEFTDFPNVGVMQTGDLPVGTRAGQNAQFDFPGAGIQDVNGSWLLGWSTVGASAVNYIQTVNSISGQPPGFMPAGIDANIGIGFSPKGNGGIHFATSGAANFSYLNSGLGNVSFNFGGYFALNGTAGVSSISNDNALAANSATTLPTQQAVKGYVDSSSVITRSQTYITNTDETATLPNSYQLLGTANQITSTNGTLSLPSTLIAPGTFQATTSINIGGSGATVTSFSTDGSLASNSDSLVSTQKAIKTYVDATVVPFQFGMAALVATSNITLSGIQTVDGVATTTQIVLAQNQTSAANNGLWTANIAGAWTRAPGYTTWANFYRLVVSITGGLTQQGTSWECTVGNTGTVGTDSLPFVSAAFQTYYAGAGLTLSDNIFSLTAPVSLANGGTNSTSAQTAMNTLAGAVTSAQYLRGNGSNVVMSAIQAADVPTLNQNTTGQAGSVANAVTFNNGGSGAASGAAFDGSAARTISYNTLGASPLAGSSSIATVGTITSGTWQGTAVDGAHGGTGQTTTTSGDLLVGAASNTWSKLATNLSSALTTDQFGAVGWTNLGLAQVLMGSFTSGVVAGTISAGTGLGSSFGVGNITLALSVPVVGANGGTGQTTTTVGDLLVGAASNTWSKLAKANSSMLTTDGSGNPGWQAITQYNVLSGGASGAINNIAPSTSGYVLTSNGASAQPTFQAAAFVPPTSNPVTGSTQALAINNSYYTTYAGLSVMTLPSTAAIGSIIGVRAGPSGNTFKIAQNAGQLIYYGAQNGSSVVTTTGTSGYLQSVDPNTTVDLECIVANTTWMVVNNINSLTWS